jgi:hypothetical protein
MAGAGVRLFTAGSVLTASQVNTYLMDQTIGRFADSAARDASFGGLGEPSLSEGRVCYLDSDNKLYLYDGSSWVEIGAQIDDLEVTTAKINDLAVTTGKIADSAVTSAKIADGTIVNADVNASAAVALSKLATGTVGSIVVHNASGVPTATAVTGDVTITSGGVTAIATGVIVDADVNASAAIVDTKLATIATAGKVSNSATTAASANTASAIVARDASGNFIAGKATLATADVTTVVETASIVASASTGTINIEFSTNPTVYYTSNATANWTLNVRGTSGVTLNDTLSTGQIATVTFLATNGVTPYRPTVFQVDGSAVTPKWMGGVAPSAGNASSIDAYTLAIIKTGSATFTMLASQSRFA